MAVPLTNDTVLIRDVWNHNLEEEFALIRKVVDAYPYIGMDTEFPGFALKPLREFDSQSESNFEFMRTNVQLTKLIQLGLTFSNEDGTLPTCGTDKYCLWQFNFREFECDADDIYALDSINLLRDSGIDFNRNREIGVDARRFGELLMSSGAVMNNDVHWITFHSGFDFGYLLKLVTGKRDLPETRAEFMRKITVFFPVFYDLKHLLKFCNGLYGGLEVIAQKLGVQRVGTGHQAGSDSLLTCCSYFKMKEFFFHGGSPRNHACVLYGIDPEP